MQCGLWVLRCRAQRLCCANRVSDRRYRRTNLYAAGSACTGRTESSAPTKRLSLYGRRARPPGVPLRVSDRRYRQTNLYAAGSACARLPRLVPRLAMTREGSPVCHCEERSDVAISCCRLVRSRLQNALTMKQKIFRYNEQVASLHAMRLVSFMYGNQKMPCAIMASATFLKPAMFAPATRL